MSLLAINAGSSSIKFALFAAGKPPVRLRGGKIDRIGHRDAKLTLVDGAAAAQSSTVEVDGTTLKVKRQTEAGYDLVEAALPAVVSVTAGVNEPRYPSLKGIMGAKSKPLDRLTSEDLGLEGAGGATAGQSITGVEPAPQRAAGSIVKDDGEGYKLIADFLAEKKVI